MKSVLPKSLGPAQVARFVSPAKSPEAYQRDHATIITELNTQCLSMCAIKVQCVCDAHTLSDLMFERHLCIS